MGFERHELNVLWAGMPGIRLSYIVHMAMEDIRNAGMINLSTN
jgi:hypothetical protein